jgi:uncharacterized coiled-coil DUF342 family protein
MTWYPDNPEELGAIVATMSALGIAWKKYRSERRNGRAEENVEIPKDCPAHQAVIERLAMGNDRFKSLEEDMGEVKSTLSAVIERLDGIKEQVSDNRKTADTRFDKLADLLSDLKERVVFMRKS